MHACPLAVVLKKRRTIPCKPRKYTTTRGSSGKPTDPRPSLRPLKGPEVLKSEAKANGPAIGDALKRSCLRCADRHKVEAREQRNSSSAASWMIAEPTAVSR